MDNKIQLQLMDLGFRPNSKQINRFRPHFTKGKDVLFIMNKDYWLSKIIKIDHAFSGYNGNVYGVFTDAAPRAADKDWVTSKNLTLIQLEPLKKGQWAPDGNSLQYVEYIIK